jgi:hypothetical protein
MHFFGLWPLRAARRVAAQKTEFSASLYLVVSAGFLATLLNGQPPGQLA